MKCSYCGNTSGKRDTWGGCVSCGGQDFISERTRALPISFTNGFMSADEIRLEYMGTSGGYSFRDNRFAPAVAPPPREDSKETIKSAIYKSLGLEYRG